ncbi:peroxidase-like protein [Enterobacter asburiae]|nr:peroxidase-like protein [Enterobacter asburiae]
MSLSQDILAELAEIKPGSPLAEARATRDAATRHAPRAGQLRNSL